MSVIITLYIESNTCNNIRRRNKPTSNPSSSINNNNNNNATYSHRQSVRKPLLTKPTILSSSNRFSTRMPRSSHGFDRKAQLLAYARELRQHYYNSKNTKSWPQNSFPNNRPKTKWSWFRCPRVNYRPLLSRIFCRSRRQWRYKRIRSEDKIKINNNVKGRCSDATKAQTKRSQNYYRRIRCMLKELACGWNCAKAGVGTVD